VVGGWETGAARASPQGAAGHLFPPARIGREDSGPEPSHHSPPKSLKQKIATIPRIPPVLESSLSISPMIDMIWRMSGQSLGIYSARKGAPENRPGREPRRQCWLLYIPRSDHNAQVPHGMSGGMKQRFYWPWPWAASPEFSSPTSPRPP
jgi:hypothetical protein